MGESSYQVLRETLSLAYLLQTPALGLRAICHVYKVPYNGRYIGSITHSFVELESSSALAAPPFFTAHNTGTELQVGRNGT